MNELQKRYQHIMHFIKDKEDITLLIHIELHAHGKTTSEIC